MTQFDYYFDKSYSLSAITMEDVYLFDKIVIFDN